MSMPRVMLLAQLVVGIGGWVIITDAAAADGKKSPYKVEHTLEPTLIDSKAGNKKALAVQFDFGAEGKWDVGGFAFRAEGMHSFEDDVPATKPMEASLEGSLALFRWRDCYDIAVPDPLGAPPAPLPVVGAGDGAGASDDGSPPTPPVGSGPRNRCQWGYTTVGLAAGGEADQDFDDRQHTLRVVVRSVLPSALDNPGIMPVYAILDAVPAMLRYWSGVDVSYAASPTLEPAIKLGYGTVDPQEDDARKTALGVLEQYDRADLEFSLATMVGTYRGGEVKLAYNYRYYREINADRAIKAAGLHRSRLSSVRLMFPSSSAGGVGFLGYTTGRLPFGVKDDAVLEIGFSFQR